VAELAPREDHRIQQLLDLGIARLGVRQDLTDVVVSGTALGVPFNNWEIPT
jgi:hypothetical protein